MRRARYTLEYKREALRLIGTGQSIAAVAATVPDSYHVRQGSRVAPSVAASSSVRVELSVGSTRLDLHWPLSHTVELAARRLSVIQKGDLLRGLERRFLPVRSEFKSIVQRVVATRTCTRVPGIRSDPAAPSRLAAPRR